MMRITSTLLLILPFVATVAALCNVTGLNAPSPTNLLDLRTPTPYTWTLSAEVTGCATAPETITLYDTWLVDGTQFPAQSTGTVTFSADGTYYLTFTFPKMTVTSLYPGEPITLVDQSANEVVYHVPQGAIPYSSTSTSSSSTTSTVPITSTSNTATQTTSSALATSASSTSSGSSTPIGGIVAGAVVGGVVVIGIISFLIFKLLKGGNSASRQQDYGEDYYAAYPRGVDGAQEQPGKPQEPMRQSLRYPDPEDAGLGGVSANLRQEI